MPPTMGNPMGHAHTMIHPPFNPMAPYQGVPGTGPIYSTGAIAAPGMPLDPHLAPPPTASSPLAVNLDHSALLGQSGTDFGIPQLQTQVDPYTTAAIDTSPTLEISNSTIYAASTTTTTTAQFQVDQPPRSPPDNFASLGYIPDEIEDEEVLPQTTADQPVVTLTSPQRTPDNLRLVPWLWVYQSLPLLLREHQCDPVKHTQHTQTLLVAGITQYVIIRNCLIQLTRLILAEPSVFDTTSVSISMCL